MALTYKSRQGRARQGMAWHATSCIAEAQARPCLCVCVSGRIRKRLVFSDRLHDMSSMSHDSLHDARMHAYILCRLCKEVVLLE